MSLPPSDGLALSPAAARVARECEVDEVAARDALQTAGVTGRITATGSVPLNAHPNPKIREAWPHRTRQRLTGADWEGSIDWNSSIIGVFRMVLIDVQTLSLWIAGSRVSEPALTPMTSASRGTGGKKHRIARQALARCYPGGWKGESFTQIEQTVIADLQSRNITPVGRDTILRAAGVRK